MRRAFLDAHRLRYREELRLGEDYDLYARALLKGARYKVVHGCGYGAVIRPDSLSGKHRTLDLKRLYEADRAILASPDLPGGARSLFRQHERHIRGRYELRRFLDVKAEIGLLRAGLRALARPTALPAIVGGIAADKLDALKARHTSVADKAAGPRYLLEGRPVCRS
jgi:succinoglycan biosynthesis protein ExoU